MNLLIIVSKETYSSKYKTAGTQQLRKEEELEASQINPNPNVYALFSKARDYERKRYSNC